MGNIRGRTFVVRIGMDDGPPETFQTLGALRTNRFEINHQPQDVSSKDTVSGFTAWDASVGIKDFQVSGDGLSRDDSAAINRLRTLMLSADPTANFQLVDGTGNRYVGSFVAENYSEEGPHDGATTYSFSLRNAGDVTYEADA